MNKNCLDCVNWCKEKCKGSAKEKCSIKEKKVKKRENVCTGNVYSLQLCGWTLAVMRNDVKFAE